MQESITSKYNKLLSFRHKEVILEGVLQFHQRSVYFDCSYTYRIARSKCNYNKSTPIMACIKYTPSPPSDLKRGGNETKKKGD